ncbi:alkaline phosphatase family protein [Thermococcus sp.]
MTRVLVIGLDGATWDLLKPWADSGELPTFKELMEKGSWGGLRSTIPPWTIPAWDSMTAGKSPQKLGYATFMVKDGYKFVPYRLKRARQELIWDILSEHGYKNIVANLPNVYSSKRINGIMVAGWLNLGKDDLAYPQGIMEEISSFCGEYMIDIFDVDLEKGIIVSGPQTDKEYLERCKSLFKNHSCAFDYLINNKEWNFAFLVFVTTDRLQHRFWKESVLLSHYKEIDEWLGKLVERLDDETVLILVSDHGFGPVRYTLNINELLLSKGYLRLKKEDKPNATNAVFRFVKKSRLLPIARKIIKLLPQKTRERLIKKARPVGLDKLNIEWSNTIAFAYEPSGEIYINLKGREPHGAVSIEDYETVRDEIAKIIESLEYNGDKLRIKVLKKEEAYPGSGVFDILPDLVIVPTDDGVQAIDPKIGHGEIITRNDGSFGNHRLMGIFLAYGPGIKKGQKIEGAKIYDVAPTILHIFGLPIPKDMDGRVLMDIFEDDSEFERRKPKYVDPSYYERKKADEKLKKAIKNLKLKGKI